MKAAALAVSSASFQATEASDRARRFDGDAARRRLPAQRGAVGAPTWLRRLLGR